MKINVGSQDKTKVQAVKEAVELYPDLFKQPEIIGVDVVTDVLGHPKNLKESIGGGRLKEQRIHLKIASLVLV